MKKRLWNWKEIKLLKLYVWWYCVKRFRWPAKITRVTVWRKQHGAVDILAYYKIGKSIFYAQIFLSGKTKKISSIAKMVLKRIEMKETYLREY